MNEREINRDTALVLCIIGGWIGLHKFYEGKTGTGILYMLTCGLCCFGWIYDIIDIMKKPNPYYVSSKKEPVPKSYKEADVKEFVKQENANSGKGKVQAIKEYRQATGASLEDAKQAVEKAYCDLKTCPRCGSKKYHAFITQKEIIPEKRIVRHSANLNPLKPFTFANSKEKVVRAAVTKEQSKFVCDNCGKIFEKKI